MDGYDFDDDDRLINDYIEEGDEVDGPPWTFQATNPDEVEFVMMKAEAAANKSSDGNSVVHSSTTTASAHHHATASASVDDNDDDKMEDEEDIMEEDAMDDDDPPPATTVRLNYAKKRCKQKDPYAFERYKGENSDYNWRSNKAGSPTGRTMQAKKWKDKSRDPLSSLLLHNKRKEIAPYAPDAQLLSFLRTDKSKVQPKVCMPAAPVPGKTCLPLTLGDGTRVYCTSHAPKEPYSSSSSSTPSSFNSSTFDTPLGVSMAVLLQRVQTARRRNEHAKQQQLRQKINDSDSSAPPSSSILAPDHQLWVDKHAPHSFAHLLSEERANREVVRALREWDPYVFHRDPPKRPEAFQKMNNNDNHGNNNKKGEAEKKRNPKDKRPDESHRVILLAGTPGVGKTTLAHIVARHCGYRPIEVNGSDERSESALTERVVRAMESSTLNFGGDNNHNHHHQPNCLILDEIDGADAARAIQSLVNIIRAEMPAKGAKSTTHLRRPIIFICNNKFAPALKPLLPYAKQFNVNPPSQTRLVARLRSILAVESLSCGSSALLNQLVAAAGGDIRSCLYTLQFASAKAKSGAQPETKTVDIANALKSTLGGDSLKDERNDVAGTMTTIFRKEKEAGTIAGGSSRKTGAARTTDKVLEAVRSFGDNSKILDCLFLNMLHVSYIDPTLDRCAAAHEWMSSSDIYRSNRTTDQYTMETLHIPSVAAAIHLLCRVEQRQDLTYSRRELNDTDFLRESNIGLAQKFFEGLSLQTRGARGVHQLASEIVPYALWMLSAGEGSSALDRGATSVELLSKGEQVAFKQHAATLRSLGLTYVAEQEEAEGGRRRDSRNLPVKIRLEPPIEQLVKFSDLTMSRQEIPPALKEMLSRQAVHDRMREVRTPNASTQSSHIEKSKVDSMDVVPTVETGHDEAKEPLSKRAAPTMVPVAPPAKKAKAQNFLIAGAKKAKAARSARTAARVGFERSKKDKLSNTGSGIPISQVIRLKYVKGFTQAVRTPCRLDDL